METEMYADPEFNDSCFEIQRIADYNAKRIEDIYTHFEVARLISYANIEVPHYRDTEYEKFQKVLQAEKFYLFRKIDALESKIENLLSKNSSSFKDDDDMDISIIVPNKSKANSTKLQCIPHVESIVSYGTTPVRSSNKFSNMTKAFNTTEVGNVVKGFFNHVTKIENDSGSDMEAESTVDEVIPRQEEKKKPFQIYKDPTLVRAIESEQINLKYSQLNESSQPNQKFPQAKEDVPQEKRAFGIYQDSIREHSVRKTSESLATPMGKNIHHDDNFEDTMPIATPKPVEKTAFDVFKGPLHESTKAFARKNPNEFFNDPIYESTKALPRKLLPETNESCIRSSFNSSKSVVDDKFVAPMDKGLIGPLHESTKAIPKMNAQALNQMKGPLFESTKALPFKSQFVPNNQENSSDISSKTISQKRKIDNIEISSPAPAPGKKEIEAMTPSSKFRYFLN